MSCVNQDNSLKDKSETCLDVKVFTDVIKQRELLNNSLASLEVDDWWMFEAVSVRDVVRTSWSLFINHVVLYWPCRETEEASGSVSPQSELYSTKLISKIICTASQFVSDNSQFNKFNPRCSNKNCSLSCCRSYNTSWAPHFFNKSHFIGSFRVFSHLIVR